MLLQILLFYECFQFLIFMLIFFHVQSIRIPFLACFCTLGGGQPRRNSSITCNTVIRSGDQAPNSNDDELVTDALMGRSKTGGSSGHASSQGAAGNIRAFNGDNGTSDLKNELQTGYDVKIGDGMDIGIHGENGKFDK